MGIEPGVTGAHVQGRQQSPRYLGLDPLGPGRGDVEQQRIVWSGPGRIGAVEAKRRHRCNQRGGGLPFRADFVVLIRFGFEIALVGSLTLDRLIARAGLERSGV